MRVKLFNAWQSAQATLAKKRETEVKLQAGGKPEKIAQNKQEIKDVRGKKKRNLNLILPAIVWWRCGDGGGVCVYIRDIVHATCTCTYVQHQLVGCANGLTCTQLHVCILVKKWVCMHGIVSNS